MLILSLGVCIFMLVRNEITYRIRGEALERVSQHAQRLIADGNLDEWRTWYARLDERSYNSILWDPFCWRVEQAYPWVTELPRPWPTPHP